MSLAASNSLASSDKPEPTACFAIVAKADPGSLPRILEPFAKRGLVPSRCDARRTDERLDIEVELAGMERGLAEYVARCLRQIHLVERVATCEKS